MSILIAVIGAALILLLVMFALKYIYDYEIRDQCIQISLFRLIPLSRIKYRDIDSISVISFLEIGLAGLTLRLGNRFIKSAVLIQKKRGFRRVIITPAWPEEFVSNVFKKRPELRK